MRKLGYLLVAVCHLIFLSSSLSAAIVFQDGKIMDADLQATLPVQDHFRMGMTAFNNQNWEEASKQFRIITTNFPKSSFGIDARYYLGVSEFNLGEFDIANVEFSEYLKVQNNPRFFEQSIEYKFKIAEAMKNGERKHLFGYKSMPKVMSGQKMARETYDEVIASLPCHQIAAKALYSKGHLLWDMHEYRESIECFQLLIRRFPKSELAPESYLAITEVYLEQSEYEFQNPDLLALAQINLRRFKQDFPREERLEIAEQNVAAVKEIYARGLYDTGQFYERKKKPQASVLYYKNAISQFPDTHVAEECKRRLQILQQSG